MALFNEETVSGKIYASRDEAAIELFGGKTLNKVGFLNKLSSKDITIEEGETNRGDTVNCIGVKIGEAIYCIPFSSTFKYDRMSDAEWLKRCKFRVNDVYVRDEDGNVKVDEDGKKIIAEGTKTLTFGMPDGGMTFGNSTEVFEETGSVKAQLAEA